MHQPAARLEHVADDRRDSVAVHPVEGLGERRDAKLAEIRPELLPAHAHPADVADASVPCAFRRLVDHAGVGVDADHLGEQRRQRQRQRAGPAADVQQAAGAVELKLGTDGRGQRLGVGQPPHSVVGGAALVERLVPAPVAQLIVSTGTS